MQIKIAKFGCFGIRHLRVLSGVLCSVVVMVMDSSKSESCDLVYCFLLSTSTTMTIAPHIVIPRVSTTMHPTAPTTSTMTGGARQRVRHRGLRRLHLWPLSMFFLLHFLYTLLKVLLLDYIITDECPIVKYHTWQHRIDNDGKLFFIYLFSFYCEKHTCPTTTSDVNITSPLYHYQEAKKAQETSEVDVSWPWVCFPLFSFLFSLY